MSSLSSNSVVPHAGVSSLKAPKLVLHSIKLDLTEHSLRLESRCSPAMQNEGTIAASVKRIIVYCGYKLPSLLLSASSHLHSSVPFTIYTLSCQLPFPLIQPTSTLFSLSAICILSYVPLDSQRLDAWLFSTPTQLQCSAKLSRHRPTTV